VVVYFDVRPGREADFVDRCREPDVLSSIERRPGFLGGELCQAMDGSSLVALTTLWASDAAYRAWLEAGARLPSPSSPDLEFEEPGPGDVLTVLRVMRPAAGTRGAAARGAGGRPGAGT
jgi:hypothetical protein